MSYPVHASRPLNVNITNATISVTALCPTNSLCVDQVFFVADAIYDVISISEIHAVAGNDAGAVNLQITKDSGTNAPGAGVDLLTNNSDAGFNLKGAANTAQAGALVTADASKRLALGDRLSLDFAGTLTTLAGVAVSVVLRRVVQ